MINAIIIEDEFHVRAGLRKMLKLISPSIKIVAETGYISEAVYLITEKKIDLIFLDIQLEDGNGLELLDKIDEINFKIIFITAYNKYAIQAFKYRAVDYLLKPIDPSDLEKAIKYAIKNIDVEKEYRELSLLLKNKQEDTNKKIVLKTTEQRYIIPIKDIIHLNADGAYTVFYTKTQKIITSKNIKYYQDLLDNKIFFRCHQSYLININHISYMNKNNYLMMTNNNLIPVSTRKKTEIIKLLNQL